MDILQAIIIGIIEGFTEFLPISSTGHMIVASQFLGIEQTAVFKAYEVIIQFAAILAVMLLYRDKINIKEINLWTKIIVAFLPLAIIGFLLKDWIKEIFIISTVAWMFIIGGIIFLIVEYFHKEENSKAKDIDDVTWRQSLLIGFGQVLSLVPGTSRAGATIITGMLSGVNRKASTEFSFLLAIPVMMAVSGYDLLKHYDEFLGADLTAFIIGFIVAFVVAYLTIKLFIVFLQRFTFVAFGIYRILFGIFLLIII
ncbi:undecaprenyl-diphosphate phosphatase [Candidatus Marithrix sp. Canyon 246]|uniref:undecaprenyl-diphosphate phosphatase n=1 Tax=Candidatus Marithrix sp. Canyon 246 TaxID=1827136 RepID=UPI00084A1D6F|nr:undecaprenyl-diphosphate phosphatase [Candidatus Marithrix sp. Canyon 246]